MALGLSDADGFSRAQGRDGGARPVAGARHRPLRRILDRHAGGADPDPRPRRRPPGRGDDRHPAERPGTRDQLRPGRRRAPRRPLRRGPDRHGGYRCRQGRRRVAFGPFDADGGNGDREGRRSAARKGEAGRGRAARSGGGRCRLRGRTVFGRGHRPHRDALRGRRGVGWRGARGRRRQRDAHPGLSQRVPCLRGRGRSGDRRCRRSSATPRSTMWAARSTR